MADLTPNNREEFWLQGMVEGQTTLEPNKRREYWYKEIVDAIGSGGGGGTGGGVLVVGMDMQTMTLDKTWNEINSAPFAVVRFPMSLYETTIGFIYTILKNPDTGECMIVAANGSNEGETTTWHNAVFIATTENDYPVMRNS